MKFYLLLVAISLLSHTAYASEQQFYLGGGVGAIVIDGEALFGGEIGVSFYGGYEINSIYKLELAYHLFSKVEDEPATISPSMLSFSGLAFHPLSDQLSIFGRLGIAQWDADINFSGIDLRTKSGTDITLGFGFEFRSSENIRWRQEYQYFQFGNDTAHTLFVSVNYQF